MSAPIPVEVVNNAPTLLDWLTAIGTVGAVVVALGLGVAEHLRGRADRLERRAERRREQAAQVNAWLQVEVVTQEPWGTSVRAQYYLQNASSAPVYDLVVHLPPRFWTAAALASRYGILVPTNGAQAIGEPEDVNFDSDSDVQLEHSFRDSSGLWWRRDTNGILNETPGDPNPNA